MSDLSFVLPNFPLTPHDQNIVLNLEKLNITISDLLTLDQLDVSKRAVISILDLRRFTKEVIEALHSSLQPLNAEFGDKVAIKAEAEGGSLRLGLTGFEAWKSQLYLSTGDSDLDRTLNGGIMTGGLTEIVGESGTGKTQILLQLCCVIQLPRSLGGLSKIAIYISTEAPLSTIRLTQLISSFRIRYASDLQSESALSTDNVLSITCGDLESQEHILNYQLPVAVARNNVGLIVVDSVAANFRAEFDGTQSSGNAIPRQKRAGPALLADRGKQLVKMAQVLRNIARKYNIAVVVANQVADKIEGSNHAPISVSDGGTMALDHQSRWFTGWGDEMYQFDKKVPTLGLVWTNCIGARIALLKNPNDTSGHSKLDSSWERRMKVVFAPWAQGGQTCYYVIEADGVRGVAMKS